MSSTPATAAGRALLNDEPVPPFSRRERILAIEAEARQQERERIRAALRTVETVVDYEDQANVQVGYHAQSILSILDAPEADAGVLDVVGDA